MNSRPRPGPPETTASERTAPTGRVRKPPAPGPRGAGRAIGISGRESTTARVAVGRDVRFSVTWTDWTPPGPWTMGPLAFGGGGRTWGRGGGGGAGRAATLATPTGTLLTGPGGGDISTAPGATTAAGGLRRLDLGALLTLELLDDRKGLVVLERG